MKILILSPAPLSILPSQRFRFEQYIIEDNLPTDKVKFTHHSFFSIKTWKILHVQGYTLQKLVGILFGFLKRLLMLFSISKYDFVYIHREASPVGPPIFEWIIAKIIRKKIIYDFDDAIWVSGSSIANPKAGSFKCAWKVAKICKWSYIVTVGNKYLANYASQFCKDVRVIPSVVNTEKVHKFIKNQNELPIVIGWTGTYTNFESLKKVDQIIAKLQFKHNVKFLIIANKDPHLQSADYEYLQWNLTTEIQDLLRMNIGIMPLEHTDVGLGKCAFKAIQYMSLGIPPIVSPVGANVQLVSNGVDGYFADNENEWFLYLENLILSKSLREEMGRQALKRIKNSYSVNSTQEEFFNLFNHNNIS